jgi:rare lipoprotein A
MMTKKNWQYSWGVLISIALGLGACSSNRGIKEDTTSPVAGSGQHLDARSACGNDPSYTIEGKTYKVLDTAVGYSETGTATWYGAEYQGTETASCEAFDMYAYSAAHRTLPLPSFVRVTNQQNGKAVIVRINDRGPFEGNDLIQLSFAAANALGIKSRAGTPVKLEALSPDQLEGNEFPPALPVTAAKQPKPPEVIDKSKVFYVVAGAWTERNAAIDMFVRLTSVGLAKTEMATVQDQGHEVHQVRIGPLYNQDQIDNVKDALESNGLSKFKVVAQQ